MSLLAFMVGSADLSDTIWERGYDHNNYITTKGLIRPFPTDIRRMSKQAAMYKPRFNTIKGARFGIL